MLLVHLTPATSAAAVRRGGIKPWPNHRLKVRGVYAMPVLPSYVLTYQWGRELRRSGTRTVVAVHFRVPDDEEVWVGHYGRPPVSRTAAEAAALIMGTDDPRGYEMFVPRKITAREIHHLRPVNPVTGWRYEPGIHGTPPCGCDACSYGVYGAARVRAKTGHDLPAPTKPELMRRLAEAGGDMALIDALWSLGNRRWRAAEELAYLADHGNPEVRETLATVLGGYRGPAVRPLLTRLAEDEHEAVRAAAEESLADPR
jgi:hypothetical protein